MCSCSRLHTQTQVQLRMGPAEGEAVSAGIQQETAAFHGPLQTQLLLRRAHVQLGWPAHRHATPAAHDTAEEEAVSAVAQQESKTTAAVPNEVWLKGPS